MANKIGVYLDKSNIGGGLDIEALADGLRKKWGELLGVVKVVPVLAESVEEVSKDIAEQDLDGVLLCGASPRVDADLYRFPPHNGQAIQVGHVNLREQCVLCFPTSSDNSFPPSMLEQMARDYLNMGVVRLQKTGVSEPAIVRGDRKSVV